MSDLGQIPILNVKQKKLIARMTIKRYVVRRLIAQLPQNCVISTPIGTQFLLMPYPNLNYQR